MRKIKIKPLKNIHRLIKKNKEKRKAKKIQEQNNYGSYFATYDETIALATELQYIR